MYLLSRYQFMWIGILYKNIIKFISPALLELSILLVCDMIVSAYYNDLIL